MPSTSPMAQPVRQCRVAAIAARHASFMQRTLYPSGVSAKYRRPMRRPLLASVSGLLLAATGCSDDPAGDPAPPTTTTSAPVSAAPTDPSTSPTTPSSTRRRRSGSTSTGPWVTSAGSPATSARGWRPGPAFREAAAYVRGGAAPASGYDVRRQAFPVPGRRLVGRAGRGRALVQRRRDAARLRPGRAAPPRRRPPRHRRGRARARRTTHRGSRCCSRPPDDRRRRHPTADGAGGVRRRRSPWGRATCTTSARSTTWRG